MLAPKIMGKMSFEFREIYTVLRKLRSQTRGTKIFWDMQRKWNPVYVILDIALLKSYSQTILKLRDWESVALGQCNLSIRVSVPEFVKIYFLRFMLRNTKICWTISFLGNILKQNTTLTNYAK